MATRIVRWICVLSVILVVQGQYNPSILEDSRVHPSGDGSFGFLYRTQDGIAHAAKGDPGGAVHGRFTYTDPTGLKVNFNYNAGAQALRDKNQPQAQAQQGYAPRPSQPIRRPPPTSYDVDGYGNEQEQYQNQPRYNRPSNGYRNNEFNDDYDYKYNS